jgi:pimeloyl-ACP methyl ester carboxylesterase
MTERAERRLVAGAGIVAGTAVAATAAAMALALRRWGRAGDPADGLHDGLPGAHEAQVRTADGALIALLTAGPERGGAHVTSPSPPLFVLAHGWTNDRRVWFPVARLLVAAGCRVALYDQRGHGASTLGTKGMALEALAGDLLTVLEHLDARDAVVAGHSMGGMGAQVMATLHPEAVAKHLGALVLVATACDGAGTGRPATDRLAQRVIAHRRVEQALAAKGLAPFMVRRTFGRRASREHLDALCEMFVATPSEIRVEALAAVMALDLSDALGNVTLPVTVVAGSRDNLLPPARARRIAHVIPGSRLITFEGVGHMVPWEAPGRMADLLSDIASSSSAGTPDAGPARRPGAPSTTQTSERSAS